MVAKLSEKTIQAQQALSNKHGIPTFNSSGGLSTVPTNGKLSNINVGLGSFKSKKTLNVAITRAISEAQAKKIIQSSNAKKSGSVKKAPSVFSGGVGSTKAKVPVTLSKTTINAQQALSEKFGIPTFNTTGGVSTVPKSLEFSDINVGFGKYKDVDSLAGAIVDKFASPPVVAPTPTNSNIIQDIGNFFSELFSIPPQDTTTGQEIQDTPTGLDDQSSQTLPNTEFLFAGSGGESGDVQNKLTGEQEESFIDSILNDPIKLVLAVVGVVGFVMVAGGKRR